MEYDEGGDEIPECYGMKCIAIDMECIEAQVEQSALNDPSQQEEQEKAFQYFDI
jgi:hypothetical protein